MTQSTRNPAADHARPFAITALDHVVLRVRDMDVSTAFYVDVLGCRVERERPDLGMVHLRAGASLVDLVEVNGPIGGTEPVDQARGNVAHFCLAIAPFDEAAIVSHLQRHGVSVLRPVGMRYGAGGQGPTLYLHDPDGNEVELKGPAPA